MKGAFCVSVETQTWCCAGDRDEAAEHAIAVDMANVVRAARSVGHGSASGA
jgi:hypothetical protein